MLLQPLPFSEPGRLVPVYTYEAIDGNTSFAYPNFLDGQRQSSSFAFLATYRPFDFTLTGADKAEHVSRERVSAEFFDVLGVQPIMGRNFTRSDDHIGAAPVAVVSEGFWRRRFGSAKSVLGRTITLDGTVYTIVGVMPGSFQSLGMSFTLGDVYIQLASGRIRVCGSVKPIPTAWVLAD